MKIFIRKYNIITKRNRVQYNGMQHIKGEKELTADKLSRTNIFNIMSRTYKTDKVYDLYNDDISGAFNQVPMNPSIQKRLSSTMTKTGKKVTPIVSGKINLDDGGH